MYTRFIILKWLTPAKCSSNAKYIISKQLFHGTVLHPKLSFSNEGYTLSSHKLRQRALLQQTSILIGSWTCQEKGIFIGRQQKSNTEVSDVLKKMTIKRNAYSQCHSIESRPGSTKKKSKLVDLLPNEKDFYQITNFN